jgi:hypothetical protein
MSGQGYIIEMIQQGRYVKVTAIDPESGHEVTIVGDANAPRAHLELLAARKLEAALRKTPS